MKDAITPAEVTPKQEIKTIRLLKLFFKFLITAACLWYVSTKINFKELGPVLRSSDSLLLVLSLFVFISSKIVATRRFDIYLQAIHIRLGIWQNIKLFWLGMFYNLFLPGSVSGDAYKVFLLKKTFNAPYKKTTAAVLLDRISGLLGLGILLAVYGLFVLSNKTQIFFLCGCASAAVLILYRVVRNFFPDFSKIFWSTFLWGLLVQALMVICAELIVRSTGIVSHTAPYIFIFLIAAVASVLPLTIGGGLGIREFVFWEGAKYFNLDEHIAIAVSLLFYLVTLVTSLPGIVFVFKNPIQKNTDHIQV
jgi:uncharacterized membrane protein YbhN (UPF0104 family)